ncbi:LOW QUALITY PROTEIN: hypothetical protein Dda_4652 [Drechslerella dactyloides]|uniref:Tetratricopeptide repeat and J domain-containing co-chaperone DNJ1 n=1 Tax=Drechslerella dactyloides TaxID=74499 RepID=A0AAD6NI47_DREDA|nr:LOW QUALITY PROTEIN: hypothetical protein Dda_4652 [Drechslerella dactyloides]
MRDLFFRQNRLFDLAFLLRQIQEGFPNSISKPKGDTVSKSKEDEELTAFDTGTGYGVQRPASIPVQAFSDAGDFVVVTLRFIAAEDVLLELQMQGPFLINSFTGLRFRIHGEVSWNAWEEVERVNTRIVAANQRAAALCCCYFQNPRTINRSRVDCRTSRLHVLRTYDFSRLSGRLLVWGVANCNLATTRVGGGINWPVRRRPDTDPHVNQPPSLHIPPIRTLATMRLTPSRRTYLATAFVCVLSLSLPAAASDVPKDVPVKTLVDSANALLAKGQSNDALQFFDAAIEREPSNYLTIFKRGTAYLSLGRTSKATDDFNRVLEMKPDFEAALLQRARIKLRAGDWTGARKDFKSCDSDRKNELAEIDKAESLVKSAHAAHDKQDWQGCTDTATEAIFIAPGILSLRETRYKCRIAKGEVLEAIGDLNHISMLSTALTEPHIQIANLHYYSLNDFDRAMAQIRKCLHYDPDSKPCKKPFRRLKSYNKSINQAQEMKANRKFLGAARAIIGTKDEPGVLSDVRDDLKALQEEGLLNENTPSQLLSSLLEFVCEAYTEGNNEKRARPFCEEALQLNPDCIPAIIAKAKQLLDEELFEEAIQELNHAKELSGGTDVINELLQKAHVLLKRSKSKDYYKILGVERDASPRQIKSQYNKMVRQFHPDKIQLNGLTREQAERKMESINEAYEVLRDEELRERFDNGDDPNDQTQRPFQQGGPFGGFPGGGQPFFFNPGQGGFPGGGGGFKFQFHHG